jgi:hypothetical protein
MPQIPSIIASTDQRPLVKVVNQSIANPPAGASFSFIIPTGYRARLVAIFMQFATDVNVADRFIFFTLESPSGIICRLTHTVAVTESLISSFQFQNGSGLFNFSVTNLNHIANFPPEITLEEGDSINVTVTGIQAGDQFSLINMHLLSQFVAE